MQTKKTFSLKDVIIVVLAVIVVILLAENILSNNKSNAAVYKNKQQKNSVISKNTTLQKNTPIPNENPVTVTNTVLSLYKTCVNDLKCPLSSTFRKTLSEYIKNVNKVNPLTRLNGPILSPQISIITELPTIAMIKIESINHTDIMEFNYINKNGSWLLNNTYCFSSPQTAITPKLVPICK
jgi:hypothetical protein